MHYTILFWIFGKILLQLDVLRLNCGLDMNLNANTCLRFYLENIFPVACSRIAILPHNAASEI